MAATLNVQFIDPAGAGSMAGAVTAVVNQAFAAWTQQFDYSTGNYTLNVSFAQAPADARIVNPTVFTGGFTTPAANVFTQVGQSGARAVVEPNFGLAVSGASAVAVAAPTLYLNPGFLDGSRPLANALAPLEREFGHELGIRALVPDIFILDYPYFQQTVFDGQVRPSTAYNDYYSHAYFTGAHAEAVAGGPVPVSPPDPGTTIVGGFQTVDTTTQGASGLQPLDVALLEDAGIRALSQQELAEHAVARLYDAAFGRHADSAGLIVQYAGLRAGLTLAQLADGFVNSAEFANHYGTPGNADFAAALYSNVLGRTASAAEAAYYTGVLNAGADRGAVLAGFADSDEERGRLDADPNLAYAATAEAQVARLFDTAFGRPADPGGFDDFVPAVVSGTTLQQAAMTFLGSQEFANRYGTAPSDQAIVDGLYQNTLHRAPDAAGEALFVHALGSGAFGRADLLVSFSESQEHINLMAQAARATTCNGFAVDLTPHLGIIPMIGATT